MLIRLIVFFKIYSLLIFYCSSNCCEKSVEIFNFNCGFVCFYFYFLVHVFWSFVIRWMHIELFFFPLSSWWIGSSILKCPSLSLVIYCEILCIVSERKSAVISYFAPSYVNFLFSLFLILLMMVFYNHLIMICPTIVFFEKILLIVFMEFFFKSDLEAYRPLFLQLSHLLQGFVFFFWLWECGNSSYTFDIVSPATYVPFIFPLLYLDG